MVFSRSKNFTITETLEGLKEVRINIMNDTILTIITTALTAILVGAVSLIATVIANRHSSKQQQLQWEREREKLKLDQEEAREEREHERQKIVVNQLQEIYGNAIATLTILMNYEEGVSAMSHDIFSETIIIFHNSLALIVAYHHDKESKEYQNFFELYRSAKGSIPNHETMSKMRDLIIEFAARDPRLNL